ncbi:MAG: divalent-cation tolerance protein CutA [Actinobacteria bacterium]|nr:divalent-cation tolerance protein CutA [Actinomycetota bacterium]
MSEFIQVFTTMGDREEAEKISRAVVEGRAAACGQVIGPIRSTYWWEGKLETSEEWLCLFKTVRDSYPKIELLIKENHSYDVPEIIAVPITAGSKDYLFWLSSQIS